MSEEIKEILENVKKCCEIMKDQSFVVYQKTDILKLLEYIQQLENIIKEAREFAKLRKEMYERQENVVGQEVIISFLEILDKEN